MNLQRIRIGSDPGAKKGTGAPHAGGHKRVRVQNIQEGVELSCTRFPRHLAVSYLDASPYPWQQPQPHRLTCHAQRSQKINPSSTVIVGIPGIINPEPRVIADVPRRVWEDVREDGQDKFVWEIENCEKRGGMDQHSIQRTGAGVRTEASFGSRRLSGG